MLFVGNMIERQHVFRSLEISKLKSHLGAQWVNRALNVFQYLLTVKEKRKCSYSLTNFLFFNFSKKSTHILSKLSLKKTH